MGDNLKNMENSNQIYAQYRDIRNYNEFLIVLSKGSLKVKNETNISYAQLSKIFLICLKVQQSLIDSKSEGL